MAKYQIQTRLANNEWECTEEFPTTFNSYIEAFDELEDFVNDCMEAVARGHLTDFNPMDWRLFEIVEDESKAIKPLKDAFEKLLNHQDIFSVRESLTLIDQALQILEKKNVGQH